MKEWFETSKGQHPPEGLKVLCMHEGDFYVSQKFGDIYAPLPMCDSNVACRLVNPEKWQYIEFPEPYTGFIHFGLPFQEGLITMEELKIKEPKRYKQICDIIREVIFPKVSKK